MQTVAQIDMETTATIYTVQHFSDSNVTFLYCENVTVSLIERRSVPTVTPNVSRSAQVKLDQVSQDV